VRERDEPTARGETGRGEDGISEGVYEGADFAHAGEEIAVDRESSGERESSDERDVSAERHSSRLEPLDASIDATGGTVDSHAAEAEASAVHDDAAADGVNVEPVRFAPRPPSRSWSTYLSSDLAIDLGTANTLVSVRGETEIRSEPSVVAMRVGASGNDRALAVGIEAKRMLGRTPDGICTIRPLKSGVIADFTAAEFLLRHFIETARKRRFRLLRPKVVIAVPAGITSVEKRAVRDAASTAGAREVHLIEEPMAAAIGSQLEVTKPEGSMIVDIGGGTTDVAVVSLGGIVSSKCVPIAGDAMDEAICTYVKRQFELEIGEETAERIKIQVGSAWHGAPRGSMVVKGRDLVNRVPKAIEIASHHVREAISEQIGSILHATRETLERTPAELAADLTDRGIVLTGGGAFLPGLDALLQKETGLPVVRTRDPLAAVVLGCRTCLEDPKLLETVELPG